MIPTFNKCLEYDEERLKIWIATGRCTVSEKYDGVRCMLTADGAFFRSGKKCESVYHLLATAQLQQGDTIDGELLVEGKKFAEAAGIIRRKITQPSIHMRVFDCAIDAINRCMRNADLFKAVHNYPVSSTAQADAAYDDVVAAGGEGVVYKCDSLWMKRKPVPTADVFCTELLEGTGKYANMMGAIIVDYNGISVKVGTGFNDAQRKQFWNNPDSIRGQLVEVKYMCETESGSLRQPVFIGIRDDKYCKEM